MKKEYMKPEMQVVTIKTQRQLLQSSTVETVDIEEETYIEGTKTDL